MNDRNRSRNTRSVNTVGRSTIGLLVTLSLVLVAFEWRTEARPIEAIHFELPMEAPWEHVPVVLIEKPEVAKGRKENPARKGTVKIVLDPTGSAAEPDTRPDEAGDPTIDPAPGPTTNRDRDPIVIERLPWGGKEVRPYFMDCLKRSPGELVECTEYRIHQHMERHFRMPRSMRGELRTTVTFEIDAEGNIGRMACFPKVIKAVEEEIERVLRSLPRFVPGTQNGLPVPVVHRMPIVLRSR